MTELIGDVCSPSELLLPPRTTTEANTLSGALVTKGISGVIIFNTTLGKAEVFAGDQWETITSVAR